MSTGSNRLVLAVVAAVVVALGIAASAAGDGPLDLAISLDGPTSGTVGEPLNYLISVTAASGSGFADDLTVTVNVPNGFAPVAEPGCTGSTVLTCVNKQQFDRTTQVAFYIVLFAKVPGSGTVTATVSTGSATDSNAANNTASVSIAIPATKKGSLALSGFRHSPTQPHSGHLFSESAKVTPKPASPPSVTCVAKAGTHALRGHGTYRSDLATCAWEIPVKSHGKRVAGTLTVKSAGRTATHRFSAVAT
jgi:hypothetical protein